MFNSQRPKFLLFVRRIILSSSPTPKCHHLHLQQYPAQSTFSLKFSTSTSGEDSFTVSYLINNCGFSPDSALKVSKKVHFQTPEKPDSVLSFFRNHGFSNSQLLRIVRLVPRLLLSDHDHSILPKFQFLLSKGASTSDIVNVVTKYPRMLTRSLENHIIPSYELLKGILQSEELTIDRIKVCSDLLKNSQLHCNVKLLRDGGVTDSNIARLLSTRPTILLSIGLGKAIVDVKQLGFDPSRSMFSLALLAMKASSKAHWDEKVDAYKRWGWSEEVIMEAFKRQPFCMLTSADKINAVMSFWVNHLGWNSLILAKGPDVIAFNLVKRIIPRASVLQFLLSKGLMKENASLITPFRISEDVFLKKYVKCFKDESSELLKLYEEKWNLQNNTREFSTST